MLLPYQGEILSKRKQLQYFLQGFGFFNHQIADFCSRNIAPLAFAMQRQSTLFLNQKGGNAQSAPLAVCDICRSLFDLYGLALYKP
jgi:hypothetical protein